MSEVQPTHVIPPSTLTSGKAAPGEGRGAVEQRQGVEAEQGPGGKKLPRVGGPQEARESGASREEQEKQLEQAVASLNDHLLAKRKLQFSLDEASGRTVVTVKDQDTEQVIRQIPSEVVLQLARKLNEEEPLSLFSAQV